MTRLELIRAIGDVLTEIDVLRGSIPPDAPNQRSLDVLRTNLDAQQLALMKQQFDDTTPAYLAASADLQAINDDVRSTINDITKLVDTIANLKRLIAAVARIIAVLPALGV